MNELVPYLRSHYDAITTLLNEHGKYLSFSIFGAPGSGKDKQSDILTAAGVPVIGSSELLNSLPANHPYSVLRKNGRLIPPESMAKMVLGHLKNMRSPNLVGFNGSPRAVKELEIMNEHFVAHNYHFIIFQIIIDDELALKWAMARLESGEFRPDAGLERERLERFKSDIAPVAPRAREMGILVIPIEVNQESTIDGRATQMGQLIEREVFKLLC